MLFGFWFGFGLGWVAERSGADSGLVWLVWIPFSDDERVWENDEEWNWLSILGVKGGGLCCVVVAVAGLFIHDWACLLRRHVTPPQRMDDISLGHYG
jgi:hypothetical protein